MAHRDTILVVDDHEADRYARARTLERAGFEVIQAANGRDTFKLLAQKDPRLVILDVQLPDMSGFEICRRIKSDPATSVVPVLHMSATSVTAPDQVKGLEGGADGYLVEPVAPDVLVATVRALLRVRRAEDEVREGRRALTALVSSLPGMAYRCARPGGAMTFVSAGATELTGLDPLELMDEPGLWRIMHPDDTAGVYDKAAAAVAARQPLEVTYRITTAAGDEKWVWDRSTPVRGPGEGLITSWEGFATDITDRKHAQEFLTQQSKHLEVLVRERTVELEASHQRLRLSERMAALGTLAAGLGHDIGNLLLPVRVRLDVIQREGHSGDDVAAIRSSIDYLQRLVTALRLLVVDPDAPAARTESTVLPAWWQTAQPLLRSLLPGHVRLDHHVPGDLPAVSISQPALTQAVFNLVQNAADVLRDREHGEVCIEAEAEQEGRVVRLRVRDNGPGMDAYVAARCLEPFYTTKPRQFSTGLGLSLVSGLVQQAGGTIAVRSTPGSGATFELCLPAAHEPSGGASVRGGATVEPRVAVLSLADRRLRGYAGRILELEGLSVADGDRPGDGAHLWVVQARPEADAGRDVEEAARAFLTRRPGRRVVFLGPRRGAWDDQRIRAVGDLSAGGEVREALQSAAREIVREGGRA